MQLAIRRIIDFVQRHGFKQKQKYSCAAALDTYRNGNTESIFKLKKNHH